MYLPMILNSSPISPSGVQFTSPMRPPGRSTRASSRAVTSCRGANWIPKIESTASKLSSSNGSDSASPSTHSTSTPYSAGATAPARTARGSGRGPPRARRAAAARSAAFPVPVATSSTSSPGRISHALEQVARRHVVDHLGHGRIVTRRPRSRGARASAPLQRSLRALLRRLIGPPKLRTRAGRRHRCRLPMFDPPGTYVSTVGVDLLEREAALGDARRGERRRPPAVRVGWCASAGSRGSARPRSSGGSSTISATGADPVRDLRRPLDPAAAGPVSRPGRAASRRRSRRRSPPTRRRTRSRTC